MESDNEARESGRKWASMIKQAQEREKNWRDDAEMAETAYTAGSDPDANGEVPDFNIHHSNVETIVPAIYNSTPVPDIRAKVETDQVGRIVAGILEKAVAAQIDDNALDIEVEAATVDVISAGRGMVRVTFEADEETQEFQEITLNEFGDQVITTTTETMLINERVVYKTVSWRDYAEGPASRFADIPWVAFKHTLSDDALEEMGLEDEDSPEKDGEYDSEDDATIVWEVWCKEDRDVIFIRENDGKELKRVADPLGLSGFFPIPKPMQVIEVAGKRMPICPYRVYRAQAEELDRVTKRIQAIISGLKVKGIIIGDASDLDALANADDNELVPIGNLESLIATGGIDKAIMWWPFEKAITVLRELYMARDQIKQLIYEITGISDIVRGASKTSETATAQQIKTQWGALRVKKAQRLVERHVRDLFVLTVEVIANNFSAARIQEITGAEVGPEFEQIMAGGIKQYRIDIESDSTVRSDLSRMKGEMEGFLNGTAQFFGTMGPIVQAKPELGGPIMRLYQTFANQFNLGKQAQEALEEMAGALDKSKQQEGPTPEQQAAQQEAQQAQQAMQAEMQAKQAEMQAKMQAEMQKAKMDMQRFQLDVEKSKAEMQLKGAELQLKQQQLADAKEFKTVDAQMKNADLELKHADLRLKEADLVIKAQQAQDEIDIEREQNRPVKIGNE